MDNTKLIEEAKLYGLNQEQIDRVLRTMEKRNIYRYILNTKSNDYKDRLLDTIFLMCPEDLQNMIISLIAK